jgi:hypothetical protein
MLHQEQRLERRRPLLAVAVTVVPITILTLMPGCEGLINGTPSKGFDETKLDAEETGYYQEMAYHIRECEGYTKRLYDSLQDYQKYASTHEDDKANDSLLTAANTCDVMQRSTFPDIEMHPARIDEKKLKKILPPDSMADMHYSLINVYNTINEEAWNLGPYPRKAKRLFLEREGRKDRLLAFLNAVHKIRKDLRERPVAKRTTNRTNPVNLIFHPRYTPLSIGVNTDGEASFSAELSISTPVGDFSISEANATSTGVNKMIIRSNGKERYFNLENRPIKVFIPPNYGVMMSSDDGVLYVDVRSR